MTQTRSVRSDLRSVMRAFRMGATWQLAQRTKDPERRMARIYSTIPSDYLFADHTTYLNYGYWDPDCTNLDDASEALAALLAESAGIQAGDDVLDVGFGFGEQDVMWARTRRPRRIVGLNVTPSQVAIASRRAREERLEDVLDFRQGSATAMPVPDGSFDRVVALECAFHFHPRTDFFKEAFRVLRPGGTLAVADIVPCDAATERTSIQAPPLVWVALSFDDANWYDAGDYADKVAAAGFTEVATRSIRKETFDPWRRYIVAKLDDPAFRRRIGPVYHKVLTRRWSDQEQLAREFELLDYVVVVARKPAA